MITVENLRKEYSYKRKPVGLRGSIHGFFSNDVQTKAAVNDISFHIGRGEIVGFLEPNGAGKSTTLKMLSGIMCPSAGHAEILGYVPWEQKKEFKRKISIVLLSAGYGINGMSPEKMLMFIGSYTLTTGIMDAYCHKFRTYVCIWDFAKDLRRLQRAGDFHFRRHCIADLADGAPTVRKRQQLKILIFVDKIPSQR